MMVGLISVAFPKKVITALIFGQILINRSATTLFTTHLDQKRIK